MARPVINVAVELTSGQVINYSDWCTEIRIDRAGNLRLYAGWRQRVFHPEKEWVGYGVARPDRVEQRPPAPTFKLGCAFPGCGCGGHGNHTVMYEAN